MCAFVCLCENKPVCVSSLIIVCLCVGKAGAKGADSKNNIKKAAVAKPNSIKNLFMNSNVKKPAEVSVCICAPVYQKSLR